MPPDIPADLQAAPFDSMHSPVGPMVDGIHPVLRRFAELLHRETVPLRVTTNVQSRMYKELTALQVFSLHKAPAGQPYL